MKPAFSLKMVSFCCLIAPLFGAGCAGSRLIHEPAASSSFVYPLTRQGSQVDEYHGVKVPDPYRWLEAADSPETKTWIEAQNQLTFAYLDEIPGRAGLRERLTQLWNYERYGIPHKQGGRYFMTRNDGLQNQSVLYTMNTLDRDPRVLLDPNALSPDGTVALTSYAITEDGSLMAYGVSNAGSDWQEWKVREITTRRDHADVIQWVKFSNTAWTHDGKGFFYSRYDEPSQKDRLQGLNYFHKLYYHRLGTPQSEDFLIYQRPDQKEWGFSGDVTEDGQYLALTIWEGTDTRNRFFYKDLSGLAPVVELLNDFDADYTFIANDGPLFWFKTDLKAPRARVIAIDITKPGRSHWKEIIPQTADTLRSVTMVNDQFIANYLKDARSQIKIFDRAGRFIREVDLPGLGTASGFFGKRTEKETFYSFTSFTMPATIYRYDMAAGKSAVFRQPKVDFDASKYETKQVFYSSKDGTRVPMFITHRKAIKLDGSNPTYLYGYGGFNASLSPNFSPSIAIWLEMGGVYAQPNLRGGGEYGEQWHKAGTKLKKQNVFDDFISAAEWLIANHYTSTPKLAIGGGSNGGLLVGACVTQRPELFGAAVPAVGVMDMLRFHKFTIGWAWVSDYGSADDPEEFKALYAYSPLHAIKPGTAYPPTLLTTADHDDRVVPAHSFKFAAALQEAQAGPAPILIRIETKAGHGAGKPTSKIIEEVADRWAFLSYVLKMPSPEFPISQNVRAER